MLIKDQYLVPQLGLVTKLEFEVALLILHPNSMLEPKIFQEALVCSSHGCQLPFIQPTTRPGPRYSLGWSSGPAVSGSTLAGFFECWSHPETEAERFIILQGFGHRHSLVFPNSCPFQGRKNLFAALQFIRVRLRQGCSLEFKQTLSPSWGQRQACLNSFGLRRFQPLYWLVGFWNYLRFQCLKSYRHLLDSLMAPDFWKLG